MSDSRRAGGDPSEDRLDAELRALPRELAPDRDLWPEIAGRIVSRRRGWVPMAAAASVLMSAVAALFAWQAYRTAWTANDAMAAASIAQIEESYRFARHDFEADWNTRRQVLDPEVVAVIDRNLEIIRGAQRDIDQALRRSPADPALNALLQSTLAREIELYRKARDLTPRPI